MENEEVCCRAVKKNHIFNHTTQPRYSIFKVLKTNDKKILEAAKYYIQRKKKTTSSDKYNLREIAASRSKKY